METPLSARSAEIKEPNVVEILLPWLQKKISQNFFFLWYISCCTKGRTGFLWTRLWTKIWDSESSPWSRKINSSLFFPEKHPSLLPLSLIQGLTRFLSQNYSPFFGTGIYRMPAKFTRGHYSLKRQDDSWLGGGDRVLRGKEVLSRRGWSHAIMKLTAGKASPESDGIRLLL